jgi:5-deoxy-glucuronate isomerase
MRRFRPQDHQRKLDIRPRSIVHHLFSSFEHKNRKKGEKTFRSHLYKSVEPKKGYTPIITPRSSDLKYLEFGTLLLAEKGDEYGSETQNREAVLTIFGGTCSVEIRSKSQEASYKTIGIRPDVFSVKPTMVYVPINAKYRVAAETTMLEVGISTAPSESDYSPFLVRLQDTIEKTVGAGNWTRKVYTSIGANIKVQRLLVGETVNPPGNWSSSPPHKHDEKSLTEAPLEEIYFYKVKPAQGFGLQRIYTYSGDKEHFDEVYVIENNDTVALSRGYHPVVASPGYQIYYL